MAKHQRFIRLNGKVKKSPIFDRKADADNWYDEKNRLKKHLQEGLPLPLDDKTTLNQYFDETWLPQRKKDYTEATWGSDVQRYRDYVRKVLGDMKVAKINSLQVRHCLMDVTQKHEMSIKTRNKVRSLLSKIFGDAMLEKAPLRTTNPALGIRFKDPRMGKKAPPSISREKDIKAFLKAAKEDSDLAFTMVCTFLMSAIRKSELIALKWSYFDDDAREFAIRARFVQAEGKIMAGTKAGREEERIVSIPDVLVDRLKNYRKKSDYQHNDDYIFCDEDGNHLKAHDPNVILERIHKASGVKGNPHKLRHSFGRWFVANGGNLKALQQIMGHSNYKTTELYAELVAEQTRKERNRVSFSIDDDSEDEDE